MARRRKHTRSHVLKLPIVTIIRRSAAEPSARGETNPVASWQSQSVPRHNNCIETWWHNKERRTHDTAHQEEHPMTTKEVAPISRIVLIRLRENIVGAHSRLLAGLLQPLDPETPAILDFTAVNSIDGYGINIIAEALTRGVPIYMVAVRGRVRRMFGQARAISDSQFVETLDRAIEAIDGIEHADESPAAERRKSRRIRAHIPVEVVLNLDGRRVPTEGIIKDISEGGVYVELIHKLADIVGDDLDLTTAFDLRFALPDTTYPCMLTGSPAHTREAAATLYCGVRFNEVNYLDEDAIRVFLYRNDPDRRAGSA